MPRRGNSTSALVVFLVLIITASMAHSQKSAAEDHPECLLPEWQETDQDDEEIQANFHRMIVKLERAQTNAMPPISWQRLCEGLPVAWKKTYRPITQSEAIWIAEAYLSAHNGRDPQFHAYARLGKKEWDVWFEDVTNSSNCRLVIVSDDGTAHPVALR